MPVFEYKAKKTDGQIIEGSIEADNRSLVVARLQSMQAYPMSIQEAGGKGLNKEISLETFQRIGRREIATFTRQLSDLVRTGLPLARAVDVLVGQEKNKKMASVLKSIRNEVQGGAALSEAMGKHPRQFDSVYCSMVRAGETGGFLESVLQRIAIFQESELENRNKVASALAYPCIMVIVATVVVIILMTFVVPNFITMFEDMDRELPPITQVMIGISMFTKNWFWLAGIGLVGGVFLFKKWLQDPANRYRYDQFLLKIPLLSDFIIKNALSKFSRTLGTLLDNGVPILKAMEIVEGVVPNRVLGADLKKIRSEVAEGARLSEKMASCEHFPAIAVNMVAIGEETGNLAMTLSRVADTYENETERVMKTLVTLIEPAIIILMALVVGFIVVSMILPIFDISANLN